MKFLPKVFLLAACWSATFAGAINTPTAPEASTSGPGAGQTSGADAKSSVPNLEELRNLSNRAEHELRGNILPFWLKYARNPERGGFYGLIADDMKVHANAARGSLLTSRILWTFSTAYRVYREPQYLEMARWAYRDLMENFRDPEFGGLLWTITADGKPLDARKQIYGQVFGIYALAEFHRATGEQAALDEAIAIYRLVEKHARDPQHDGYFDVFDRQWVRMDDKRNLLGAAPKSQNSHIHILEAYTNLLRAWPDAGLRDNQRALIEVTLKHLIDPKNHHLVLFVRADWSPLSKEISYGHDIELSWLIVEAASVLGDPELLNRVKPVALSMAEVTLAEGVDADGGVINEGGPHGYTNTDKDWWNQAEATVGFLNAYETSQNTRYLTAARRSWDFIDAKFVDRTHGDWIESVTREGVPLRRPKVSIWKCPYHHGRACLELVERVHRLTAGGSEAH